MPREGQEALESHDIERKSLRKVTGKTADFHDLARTCVCFANGSGGRILIGIEDGERHPPFSQRVAPSLLAHVRKRVGELTVNVEAVPNVQRDSNGGELIVLTVARANGVASTSDGRYFIRVGDTCQPIVGDDVLRLLSDRPSIPWELGTALGVPASAADPTKIGQLTSRLRASDRVKHGVKEKSVAELLEHYALSIGGTLTNLGVLLVGDASLRARLGTAPVVQAISYDERGTKVAKLVWDDHTLSPLDLVDAVWAAVPEFRESYELPDGMFRTAIPAFEEVVVRELLVNALVHRPYTQRGDIFLNLHPDRLEVVNPGRLPLGVTPRNILHQSRRRNDALARVFHDLKLMEREGSGFDLLYDRLLTSGRPAPQVTEGTDSVHVVVPRRIVQPGIVRLIAEADQRHHLTQRERIALGLLAQTEGLLAAELATRLELDDTNATRSWIDRLLDLGLVEQSGQTRAARYFVPPHLLRGAGLETRTTLARIPPHRLRELVLEDLRRFPDSSRTDIQRRIGAEIHPKAVKRTIDGLIAEGAIEAMGERRWRRYRLTRSHGQKA